MNTTTWVLLYLALVLLFAIVVILLSHRREDGIRRARRKTTFDFIPAEEFMENWILDETEKTGYKYERFSGCYVIVIFEEPVTNGDYRGYDEIYIGQSVNVTNRVHSHFTGKGNGDVYADIKYGSAVYVQMVPCEREEMNDLERALIDVFHSTDSYNATQGGGQDRTKRRGLFRRRNN